jgi:hypothetical protein
MESSNGVSEMVEYIGVTSATTDFMGRVKLNFLTGIF